MTGRGHGEPIKSNGSLYVAIVLALLAGYFTYQWWLNPQRAIKRQLGELAAALSATPGGSDMDRFARAAGLRRYFAPDVHVKTRASDASADAAAIEFTSRDALVGAIAAWVPSPAGWSV